MRKRAFGLMAVAGLFAGCDNDLDSIDGHRLGEPKSVIYGTNESGQIMVVMSDLPNLCESVRSADPPSRNNFWVLSTWSLIDADRPGSYVVDSYASITENGTVHEYQTESGKLDVFSLSLGRIKAGVNLRFPTGDDVTAEVEGRECDVNLFVGLR